MSSDASASLEGTSTITSTSTSCTSRPDLIKIGEDDYIEIPQTKTQRLATLAFWRNCDISEIPAEALVPYGLTVEKRNEAAMDSARGRKKRRETAQLWRD